MIKTETIFIFSNGCLLLLIIINHFMYYIFYYSWDLNQQIGYKMLILKNLNKKNLEYYNFLKICNNKWLGYRFFSITQ